MRGGHVGLKKAAAMLWTGDSVVAQQPQHHNSKEAEGYTDPGTITVIGSLFIYSESELVR